MKKRILIPLAMMFIAISSYAQDPIPPPVPTAAVQPAVPAVTPAAPVAVPDVVKVEGDKITVNDIVTDAAGVASAVKAYQDAKAAGDKMAIRLGLMLLLAAIFKILLSCLKFTSEFWKGDKGKLALRASTVVLGVAVFFTSHLGAGETWMNAGLLALSGPLAISVHELFDIIVNLVQKKPAPAAAPVK